MNASFADWLLDEMNKQGLSQATLARKAGVSRAAISNVINGTRGLGVELCTAIAFAFGIPPETVFRAAGILPNRPGTDEDFEELKHLFSQMSEEEQEEFLAIGRLKIERQSKRGPHETPQARPAHI
jgi:transcriptional regulator with XRE-family HTH domain